MNPTPYQQVAAGGAPPVARRLPSKERLDYLKVAVELLLLLLAVPWILRELVTHPSRASRRAAAKHLAGS